MRCYDVVPPSSEQTSKLECVDRFNFNDFIIAGTVGGSIGLGLGFSVLTLIEFLFFLFDLAFLPLYARFCKPRGENKEVLPLQQSSHEEE